jgi:hypothetical protein
MNMTCTVQENTNFPAEFCSYFTPACQMIMTCSTKMLIFQLKSALILLMLVNEHGIQQENTHFSAEFGSYFTPSRQ